MLTKLLRAHLLRPYRKLLTWILAVQTVQAVAALILPTLMEKIIDKGVIAGNQHYIRSIGAVMFGFTLVQVTFSIIGVYLGAMAAMRFGRDLRSSLFHRVTDFSTREVGTFGAPSLITRITNDVQQVQLLVVMACTMAITAPITIAVGVVLAVRIDLGLSMVLVFSMPAAGIILGILVSQMVPTFQKMQVRIDQINRLLREQITGVRVVRAFVREPEETARFAGANKDLTDVSLRAGHLMAGMFPMITLIVNGASVAVLWIGGSRVNGGHIQVGALVAYLTYLIQILMSVAMATFVVSMVPRAAVSAVRIEEVLDTDPTVAPPAVAVAPTTHGRVEFRNVGFHYPGAEHAVLTDISFVTEPGQTTAIVGSTGAGKTTLINLVPRLFDPTAGSVVINGVDVRDLEPKVLWDSIGLVPQRAYLFSGTIGSNLQYGDPDATEDQMWEALEVAQAIDFVRRMPGGLDSPIEQGGTNVSGGQRQRLAIARALIRKPQIYVFDDSFSALDLTTDARLRAALRPYTAEAAVLIVAQRASTITSADQILVLEDGLIVGKGSHEELLPACPTYREIVQSQIGEGAAA